MSVGERDPHTGHMTTGHDWNGIKELNTPVPRPVWFFLIATFLFSVVLWILMPTWPLGLTYTKGLLGIDQRDVVTEDVQQAAARRASDWADEIAARDFASIQSDEALMGTVRETGRTLFGDNCLVCHGAEARGGPGFPSLTGGAWLWGGSPEEVAETIRVGINSDHPETRVSQMLAFGRDQMLDRQAILDVTAYVQSLSGAGSAGTGDTATLAAGKTVFTENCAACHGDDGRGMKEMGAPDLTDDLWIYGGNRDAIYRSIFHGRQGHMPHWEGRLSEVDRKVLTLYLLDLGGQK